MDVLINGRKARLGPKRLIGQGGEACVYRWRDQAVKIYHAMPKRALARRMRKLQAFPAGLPQSVLSPQALVSALDGRKIGFSMRLVEGVQDIRRLSQRHWREGLLTNQQVLRLFEQLYDALAALHRQQVVVGDLNDGNILIDAQTAWLIDADSMQFDRFPCTVGHERFLDPLLFGIDLAQSAAFTPDSDWYAFSVLLFGSLLYIHPYGGVHPDYPTLLRRAEAGHSLLRGDVSLPKAAQHWRTLPDEMGDWFMSVFENRRRGVFPRQLLNVVWRRCSCGIEHAQPACPECTDQTPVPVQPIARRQGRCKAVRIHRTDGRILSAVFQGKLRYVYESGGVLYRENGQRVMTQDLAPGLRFGISGDTTYLSWQDQLVEVRDERIVGRINTPMFATNQSCCFVLQDQWLVEQRSGARVASVLEGQTWFGVGEQLGYGFYRAGLVTVHFLFRTDRPGLTQLELPSLTGRLVDVQVVFDHGQLLVAFATETAGRLTHALHWIGADGAVRASINGPPEHSPVLASLRGKLLGGDQLVCATDEGLLRVQLDRRAGRFLPAELFGDTEPFVNVETGLLPGPDGTIYLIGPREIIQLSIA